MFERKMFQITKEETGEYLKKDRELGETIKKNNYNATSKNVRTIHLKKIIKNGTRDQILISQ